MSYSLTPEQEIFRKTVRKFAEEKVAPRASEIDETDEYPWDLHEAFVEQGLLSVGYPEAYGGAGGGPLDFCILVEEISRVSAGTGLIPLVNRLGALPILIDGTEEQRKDAVVGISTGAHQYSYCLTEPESGSDAAAMKSVAKREGDGWRLNGTKRFITNAGISDTYVFFAVTDPEGQKGKNITAFLVRSDAEGFSVGPPEKKMGIRGSPTREVFCQDTYVPDSAVIGKVDDGFATAMRTLDFSRPTIAAQALGIAQGALDQAVSFTKEREQFGESISRFQGVQFMLADMAMAVEASRLLTYKAAKLAEQGSPEVGYFAAIAKAYASDTAMSVSIDAVQLHGGYGYVKEFPVERMMRDAKITQIYEGTNQIQRVVIGRKLLK